MSEQVRNALINLLHMGEELMQGCQLALAGDRQAIDIIEEDFGPKGCATSQIERRVSELVRALNDEFDEQAGAESAAEIAQAEIDFGAV